MTLFELRDKHDYGGDSYGWHVPREIPHYFNEEGTAWVDLDGAYKEQVWEREVWANPFFSPNIEEWTVKWLSEGRNHSHWRETWYIRERLRDRWVIDIRDDQHLSEVCGLFGRSTEIDWRSDPPQIHYE